MSKDSVASPVLLPGNVEAHVSIYPTQTYIYIRYVTVEFKTLGQCLLSLSIIKPFQ